MTNKPMLSVGRELLEALSGENQVVRIKAFNELRALLDKPDDEECTHEFVPFRPDCTFCGLPYKQAAQHHGEPVRWERMSKMMGGAWWPCANKAEADEAITCGWTVRPLYAEPPAPVATVAKLMQAIHDVEGFPGVTVDQLRELVARLNGVKP